MKIFKFLANYIIPAIVFMSAPLYSLEKSIPPDMQKIMTQPKYDHSMWGIYAKDLDTGEVYFNQNGNKLFSPASTTKLFSVAALLHAFGDDYRFKTPVYAAGKVENGLLRGNLILVAQGDLVMGGRYVDADKIAFTKLDHIIANEVPGVILTKEDPLQALNELAKQVRQKGIEKVEGDVIIDDRLFETIQKRDMELTPIIINENLIDIVLNPTTIGQTASLTWRPKVPGYSIENQVITSEKGEGPSISISSDDLGHKIVVKGTLPIDQRDIVRTFSIKDPKAFARAAFIQALEQNGVKVTAQTERTSQSAPLASYHTMQPVALWTSAPLSEYAKLILKVSHNLGADLIPLLLASQQGKGTFADGMRLLGDFAVKEVKLAPNSFVFIDGAGGNENRLTPMAEIQLLEYLNKQQPSQFKYFFDALPILGVDGSLEDFGRKTPAAGKIRAKPGTGVAFNIAANRYFLITQALAGYLEGKNGHLFAYIVVVNNAEMPAIDDVFAFFEDDAQLSSSIYEHSTQDR